MTGCGCQETGGTLCPPGTCMEDNVKEAQRRTINLSNDWLIAELEAQVVELQAIVRRQHESITAYTRADKKHRALEAQWRTERKHLG